MHRSTSSHDMLTRRPRHTWAAACARGTFGYRLRAPADWAGCASNPEKWRRTGIVIVSGLCGACLIRETGAFCTFVPCAHSATEQGRQVRLDIEGLKCGSCSAKAEDLLLQVRVSRRGLGAGRGVCAKEGAFGGFWRERDRNARAGRWQGESGVRVSRAFHGGRVNRVQNIGGLWVDPVGQSLWCRRRPQSDLWIFFLSFNGLVVFFFVFCGPPPFPEGFEILWNGLDFFKKQSNKSRKVNNDRKATNGASGPPRRADFKCQMCHLHFAAESGSPPSRLPFGVVNWPPFGQAGRSGAGAVTSPPLPFD